MRRNILLSGLVAVLLVAIYYILLFQPTREEIALTRDATAAVAVEQQAIEVEITRLQTVREQSPLAEAELSAARAIVPDTTASPSLLRQLQLAAQDAGIELGTVTLGRPDVSTVEPTLAQASVAVQLTGEYFQIIDFLRRMEDPSISPRGFMWDAVTVSPGEYPELAVSLTGRTFADAAGALPPVPEAPVAEEGTGEDGEAAEGTEGSPDDATEDAPAGEGDTDNAEEVVS